MESLKSVLAVVFVAVVCPGVYSHAQTSLNQEVSNEQSLAIGFPLPASDRDTCFSEPMKDDHVRPAAPSSNCTYYHTEERCNQGNRIPGGRNIVCLCNKSCKAIEGVYSVQLRQRDGQCAWHPLLKKCYFKLTNQDWRLANRACGQFDEECREEYDAANGVLQEPAVPINPRLPFDGLTGAQIEADRPPPCAIPAQRRTKGPYTSEKLIDRYEIIYTVPREQFNFPGTPAPKATNARVQVYYHNYGPNSPHPANWRYNVTVGSEEYVAIRPSADAKGPFSHSDLVIIRRGPGDPAEVTAAADAFVGGTATPEQTAMLKEEWKGMEALDKRMDVIEEKGLLSPEEISRIKDIMGRGHFVPGTYLPGS